MTVENLNKIHNWKIPTICPACGGEVVINSSGIPECINENCPKKTSHRFVKMFKVFGVKGTGEAFINNLEENDITVYDFLNKCKSDKKDCFNVYAGGINGEKIYTQMNNVMNSPIAPAQFLATFDVKLFDEKKLNQLGNKTLDEILNLSYNEIINIDGFSEITTNALLKFLKDFREEIDKLRSFFIFKEGEEKMEELQTICFTGACAGYSRSQLTELCAGRYLVKDTVTKDLNILACADPNSGSSKLIKAKKNGTKIISYDELLKNLGV